MKGPGDLLLTKGGDFPSLSGPGGRSATGLPLTLLRQSSKRLQAVSLTVVILLATGWLAANFIEGELAYEFQTPLQWAPPTLMLVASLIIFILARSSWLTPAGVITVGLVYEVIVSFCIALGQYYGTFTGLEARYISGDLVGVSAVALWMLFFTVLVPSKPSHALIALTLSGSAVPITVALLIRFGDAPAMPLRDFAFVFVYGYVASIILSYIAARIIYRLGTDIRRAREMGSYHLLDLIGRGGMGEVWRAEHNMLARPAAIKLISRGAVAAEPSAMDNILTRFEREAQVTASLQSPHTVELYDFGISEQGTFYYVMELLDGIDLESLVRRLGPLAPERVVHILRQTCLSLGEAHRRELVHRDIKPANLFLCQRAFEYDFVKVLDFGLVKHGSKFEVQAGEPVTKAGTVPGTPAYMAPEMALGKGEIDGRADIYALGCVAYWLLTGRRVFEEDTPVATLLAHVNTAPLPPSARTDLPIPAELESLVLACLSKDPAKRPQSAEELGRRLDETGLQALWTSDRAREWWSINFPLNSSSTAAAD
ncbi:MAG: serine/threonine protein kinase [Gemmatimonadota bacterium]|nr:MAG: serine/threonine protein kinase [Gemmatimonadota bacterium]